jgi:phenylacetic acid degradation protein
MMKVYAIDGIVPVIHPTAFVHPTAALTGDVIVGPRCYVGPCASLRGDFGRLILEEGCNIQDNCTMHGFPGSDTVIEIDGHVGHGAVVHGARVKRNALIGMNAVLMDGAVIGESAVVAAMAFVKAGYEVPARTLVAGVPARIVKQLSDEDLAWKVEGTREYQELTRRCLATLVETEPLTEVEPDRKRTDGNAMPLYLQRLQRGA